MHAVMQRAKAIDLGLRWYFTGKPCPHGHIAKRSISNRDCRSCVDLRKSKRRAASPEKYRDKERKYYADTIMARRTSANASRTKNLEKRQSEDRIRYKANPDRIKRNSVRWAKANKGKRAAIIAARRASQKMATPPWLTADQKNQIKSLYIEASNREGEWHVDHIHPIKNKILCGLHVPWNLQIITGDENRKKGNRLVE